MMADDKTIIEFDDARQPHVLRRADQKADDLRSRFRAARGESTEPTRAERRRAERRKGKKGKPRK